MGKAVGDKEVKYAKIILGLILLGFGVSLLTVFPNIVLSQTISYEQQAIINPSVVYETVDPLTVKENVLYSKATELVGKYGGQCVTFARDFTNATPKVISGMAKNVQTNTTTPEIGEIIKTDESSAGHVGVIIAVNGSTLTVVDSNYGWDERVKIRTINTNNPKIMGYIQL